MKNLLKIIGLIALTITFVCPLLFAFDKLSENAMKSGLMIATVAWFIVAPRIMNPDRS